LKTVQEGERASRWDETQKGRKKSSPRGGEKGGRIIIDLFLVRKKGGRLKEEEGKSFNWEGGKERVKKEDRRKDTEKEGTP